MILRKPFEAGGPLPLYVTREHRGMTTSYSMGESWVFWAMALVTLNIVLWGILGVVFALITACNLVF